MTHLALVEGLILQDISLAAVNFILTGHMKKGWYRYIKQDQLLNVIDMLQGDLKELPQVPHENISIRNGWFLWLWVNQLPLDTPESFQYEEFLSPMGKTVCVKTLLFGVF